ncbi:fused DSP-PTPase phosphatase/NAD kinase-like protein [Humisphaera borealis]|uniref:protein-tyrosine-phosphatase n=1 Tax=Humisphaera borealis TaxID=2807512 RepID=A0A7M2WWA7_9BACT|nr:dual specificity protein phosphatase family protein [Humisphaera borealis]QOV89693.1 dual specificity protein phosphatase family protein [Humisphaera borealis]
MIHRIVHLRLATAAWVTIAPVIGGCVYHQENIAAPPAIVAEERPAIRPGLTNFARVSPLLYRGAQPTAEGFRELERMGIKAVINLRSMHDDADLLAGTNLRYFRIPCSAWDVDRAQFRQFMAIINDPANQPVFVHCQHGSDRTGFVVGGYRITEQGWDAESAVAELHTYGFHRIWGHIPAKLRATNSTANGTANGTGARVAG